VVDREVERLRVALSTANGRDVPQAAQALYRRVVAPVKTAIGDARRLVISPDGALNLIPFAAVMTDEGRYLVENHVISYVTSGRDLARLRRPGDIVSAVGPPVVIANPSFEGLRVPAGATAASSEAAGQAPPSEALTFAPLPGTGEEAVAIAKLLPDPRVFTGATATEAALKQVNAPAMLHIATHGFFLGAAKSSQAAVRGLTAAPTQSGPAAGAGEDALLMSGLAMAGANQRWSGEGEDGILTALEATSLDLRGTRLVVLSACETGVGDARGGEGVYGLRRALVLAGSESQVMSLWQVSDTATRDLMIAYYRRLRAGEGRADALRQVQLDMLRTDAARAHPFYWASFIQSGDWRPTFD
jgi:CHAT domain-containing protein